MADKPKKMIPMIKNNYVLVTALMFILAGGIACKKEYHRDIPKWVKEYIKECKQRELDSPDHLGRSHASDYKACGTIKEYYEPNYGTVYAFGNYCAFLEIGPVYSYPDFYDTNGNHICEGVDQYNCSICNAFPFVPKDVTCCDSTFNPILIRTIYTP